MATRSLSGTKTDTALIETPQSISIVTRDQMRAQNAESLNQILRYSAAVVPETRGATASRLDQLTIRGFAATYLDGLRMPSSRDALPQKTPSTWSAWKRCVARRRCCTVRAHPSGVINMVTKRPLDTPFHEVGVEDGTFNKKRTTFDLSGPIDDQGAYSYRVAGLFDDADGQVEHTEPAASRCRRPSPGAGRRHFADPARALPEGPQGRVPTDRSRLGLGIAQPHRAQH